MNWALLASSIGLVGATIGLMLFTRRLVDEAALTRNEMAEARSLTIRPRLAFDLMVLGGKVGLLLVRNVGNGVALNIDLDIAFEAGDKSEARRWREPSVVPGESHEFQLPEFALSDIGSLSEQNLVIHTRGSMHDVNDNAIHIEDDLLASEWWRAAVAAKERIGGRRKLPGVDPTDWGSVRRDR